MAKKQPKPFFKKSHQSWYVQLGKRQINLGKDEEAAWQEYHRLMADAGPVTDESDIGTVIEKYLNWVLKNRAKGTHTNAEYWLDRWSTWINTHYRRGIKVGQLKPFHINNWLDDECPESTDNTKHSVIRTICRCFSWAKKAGHIRANPLLDIEVPPKTPREVFLDDDQWAQIMEHAKGEEFRDLLTVLKETGCRPFEAYTVTAKQFDRKGRRWVFERKNSKGKKYNRVVYLTDTAFDICQKWALRNPSGSIFRNRDGNQWKAHALQGRVTRLVKHLGWRLMPYAIRHTFATNALANDVDSIVVAQLMGHRDLTMVARNYSHLAQKDKFLQDSMTKAVGRKEPPAAEKAG